MKCFVSNINEELKGDEPKENVLERSIQEIKASEQRLGSIIKQMNHLSTRVKEMKEGLKIVEGFGKGKKEWIEIADTVYLQGENKLLNMKLGMGVIVEMTKEEADEFLKRQVSFFEKNIEKMKEYEEMEQRVHTTVRMKTTRIERVIYNN
eukprot:GHVP01021817.1.p1 GENE.GHVP01021817.1~~GHVP01021817.1.p1  ORF type:complete len:150 (-),score=36.37 GHVP01021817.1:23-472(-)